MAQQISSYYGSLKPIPEEILREKGVWNFMLKEFITSEITKFQDCIVDSLNKEIKRMKLQILEIDKKLERNMNILFKVEANRLMRQIEVKKETEKLKREKILKKAKMKNDKNVEVEMNEDEL